MAASNLVAFFIILTAAVTLHVHGNSDVLTATQAAKALEPLAGLRFSVSAAFFVPSFVIDPSYGSMGL